MASLDNSPMSNGAPAYWDKGHEKYSAADWIDKPTIFSQQVLGYFPAKGKILELGGGQGRDARFFAGKGHEVVLTDFSDKALEFARQKTGPELAPFISIRKLDLARPFPLADSSFDVVYGHLALHYFDHSTTQRIFEEIYRVLKPAGGIIAILVNSIDDSEYDKAKEIEEGLLTLYGIQKRFFSVESMRRFASRFEPILLDDQGETYKDRAISTTNLIRFVGRKA